MTDNKKIKLPQHLQLDSVSPATRLLEKRRLMYEVQKAFEDQKEEYLSQEKRFKIQEGELREKDIMIQDNLIKFSTFLQQQEMRKKKDQEMTQNEKNKIRIIDEEIQEKKDQYYRYLEKSKKIEQKVQQMKKFEEFLEEVRNQNQDDFDEIPAIVNRYKVLDDNNKELHSSQDKLTHELEEKTNNLNQFQKDMETEKITINNRISMQNQQLEQIENERATLQGQKSEEAAHKTKETTEIGRSFMTINNLHFKCEDLRNEMIISKKEYEESGVEKTTKNYNDSGLSCKKAIEQIKIIQQVVINFNDLSHDLESKYPEIKEALEKFRNEKNNK